MPTDAFVYRSRPNGAQFPSADTLFGVDVTFLGLPAATIPVAATATSTDTLGAYSYLIGGNPPTAHDQASLTSHAATISWMAPTAFTP